MAAEEIPVTAPAFQETGKTSDLAARRAALEERHLEPDAAALERLMAEARLPPADTEGVTREAEALIAAVRAKPEESGRLDALLREYKLSSEEGVLLMCLAEALLRAPDAETADALIGEKVSLGDWASHRGRSDSFLVNASTFGLLLSGRAIALERETAQDPASALKRLIGRISEPVLRAAILQAVRLLARDFVMGRTIEEALARAKNALRAGTRFSFDMLGEAARTMADAERYGAAYAHALDAIAAAKLPGMSISVKLSALHPRFEWRKAAQLRNELLPRLQGLAQKAAQNGIGLTIDAEEADRLEITLDLFEALARDPALKGWDGLGAVVQAYQKRARPLIDWLAGLAGETGRRIPLRLVKGAYWDSEIKRAQMQGLSDYPVFTRKPATDTSYLACASAILKAGDVFMPQFATHNAQSLAALRHLAEGRSDVEFQRLHGMGAALYRVAATRFGDDFKTRIYAPVGRYPDLLAYLVRRLLENGANSSFVSRIGDGTVSPAMLARDPVGVIAACESKAHPAIPPPPALYGASRRNAAGIALDNARARQTLMADIAGARARWIEAAPLIAGESRPGEARPVTAPAENRRVLGTVIEAGARDIEAALQTASAAAAAWDGLGGARRAEALERAGDLFEAQAPRLMALLMGEGGKTLVNAQGELREAVDALRYYAAEARARFEVPLALPGPAGERNRLSLRGRGVFACIAPWNFPLAIFTGQIAAALAAGNAVIAKPAEQTPLIAYEAVRLLHEAGIPGETLASLPGGPQTGASLIGDLRIAGIAFTGSTETARAINRVLASRPGPLIPFIAETGGINALIADATALPEQLVDDAVTGAFDSAGQRCSATRILFLREEIAPRVLPMLAGAVRELKLGDPFDVETDIGPLIDGPAREALEEHAARMARQGTLIAEALLDPALAEQGYYFAPRVFVLESAAPVERESFGPILHVVRFARGKLDEVIAAINATGYGLTLGLHTRLDQTVELVQRTARVGNLYINRNQIGAVIGVQPFGGEGLSGTGPKAGGPHYLTRFAVERTVTVNTAAAGGDTTLLSLE
jgi:RHH-type transcriptional regulator, proline utilization regulon repressor / proline dehydrogenase / delta 1-pyrroline-5-carboxylate dehydrogenase